MAQAHGYVLPFHNGNGQGSSQSLDRSGTTNSAGIDLGGGTGPQQPGRSLAAQTFARWSGRYVRRMAVADSIIGIGVALVVTGPVLHLNNTALRWAEAAFFGLLIWPLMIAIMAGYSRSRIGVARDEVRSVFYAAVAVVVGIAFFCGFFKHSAMLKTVVLAIPMTLVLGLLVRLALRRSLHADQARGVRVRTVVIAGTTANAVALHDRFAAEPDGGVGVLGACVPAPEIEAARARGLMVLGTLDEVPAVARRLGCDAIAVTADEATREDYLRNLAWSLQRDGIELLVDPGLAEVARTRMHVRPLTGFPLLHISQPRFDGWQRTVKRTTDVVLSGFGLAVLAPLLAVVALIIKLGDGGPVVFRQSRVGRDGTSFTMFKFRTMVIDAEARKAELWDGNQGGAILFKQKDDPRITRVGGFLRRFSIDELPQLFNVLFGSMSLVGPRPHLADEVARMPSNAHRRARVTPGMTGLWQVSGRSDLNETQAVRLDLRYVENWSLGLDLLILWRTASAVLARRGAH